MTQERESKLPDDSSTQEIIREKTMQMTKNIRTGYYTVVMDPKYTARPAAPGGRREQVSSSCRAHKRAMFRKKTRDVDALISEQFVSTPKHVDYSTVQNFNKTCNLEDLYETGAVFAEGGQGEVYIVDYNGEKKALKWYKKTGLGKTHKPYMKT